VWDPDRPIVGDRVRVIATVRANVESGAEPWRSLPNGPGTVTKVWMRTDAGAIAFGLEQPARVAVWWDDPGEVSPDRTWRVGDLELDVPAA
jgi:hypothetical protein